MKIFAAIVVFLLATLTVIGVAGMQGRPSYCADYDTAGVSAYDPNC